MIMSERALRLLALVSLLGGIKVLFYLLDPLPQFYGGDSLSYLHTAAGFWIPLDRSFLYGLLIRFLQRQSHSLTPMILLQVACSFASCILLYYCAHVILGLSHRMALILASLFAADPMQLLYERQIMTETISAFLFIAALTLGFSYLKKPRVWKCVLIPFGGVLSMAFRVNFYPPTWLLSFGVPLYVLTRTFFKERERCSAGRPGGGYYRLAGHLAISVSLLSAISVLYSHYYGRLTHREPAISYREGAFMLSGLWSIVIPEDAPDPKLAAIIATRRSFFPDLNPVKERNIQLFSDEGLVGRWDRTEIEGPSSLHDDLARETALNAVKRAPLRVLQMTLSNYREYFRDLKTNVIELYDSDREILEEDRLWLKERFGLAVTRDWYARSTPTKWLLLRCRWWCYVLLLCPWLGVVAAGLLWRSEHFIHMVLLTVVSIMVLFPPLVFLITHVRFLHPLGFATFLMLGVVARSAGDLIRRKSVGVHICDNRLRTPCGNEGSQRHG